MFHQTPFVLRPSSSWTSTCSNADQPWPPTSTAWFPPTSPSSRAAVETDFAFSGGSGPPLRSASSSSGMQRLVDEPRGTLAQVDLGGGERLHGRETLPEPLARTSRDLPSKSGECDDPYMRRLNGAVTVLLLVSSAGTAWALTRSDSQVSPAKSPTHHAAAAAGATLPIESGPFFGSKAITLAEAEHREPYARERPDDPVASDATLHTVWATPHRFAFEYDSGIEVQVQPWGSTADPAAVFASLAAQFHLERPPTRIGGDPAIVISLDEASPASVELVREGIKITVFGDTSTAVLRRVAGSIP